MLEVEDATTRSSCADGLDLYGKKDRMQKYSLAAEKMTL